nr:hypothetical protein Iba_chr13eCG10690 [Ipomoea batatas]
MAVYESKRILIILFLGNVPLLWRFGKLSCRPDFRKGSYLGLGGMDERKPWEERMEQIKYGFDKWNATFSITCWIQRMQARPWALASWAPAQGPMSRRGPMAYRIRRVENTIHGVKAEASIALPNLKFATGEAEVGRLSFEPRRNHIGGRGGAPRPLTMCLGSWSKRRFRVEVVHLGSWSRDRKEPSLNLVSGGGVRIAADVGGRNST